MKIPKLAIDKESKNLYHIYLFYVEEKWWAFGHSAHYLSIMYPELEDTEVISEDYTELIPCVYIPETCLLNLSAYYNTLVSDTYIQVSAPPTAYSRRNSYDEWCGKLIVNKTKLHILKHP